MLREPEQPTLLSDSQTQPGHFFHWLLIAVLSIVAAAAASHADAKIAIWTGSVSVLWSDANNWQGSAVPEAGDSLLSVNTPSVSRRRTILRWHADHLDRCDRRSHFLSGNRFALSSGIAVMPSGATAGASIDLAITPTQSQTLSTKPGGSLQLYRGPMALAGTILTVDAQRRCHLRADHWSRSDREAWKREPHSIQMQVSD